MRRADRLFRLVQQLHHERALTARTLAAVLEVSERTIYRDVQDLSLSGVPICGAAGVGYRLLPGFRMPPLMLTEEELAALLLGARMVQAWTDEKLARAAQQAIQKIESIIPEHLRPELAREEMLVPDFSVEPAVAAHLAALRGAIKRRQKIDCDYQREDGAHSRRTVHPLGLFYWGKVWTLVAWCELRDAFRHFRLDRMQHVAVSNAQYQSVPGRTLRDFLSTVCPGD